MSPAASSLYFVLFASRKIARLLPHVTATRRTRTKPSHRDQVSHTPHPWALTPDKGNSYINCFVSVINIQERCRYRVRYYIHPRKSRRWHFRTLTYLQTPWGNHASDPKMGQGK